MNVQAMQTLRLAQEQHNRGDLGRAINGYRSVLQLAPQHGDAAYLLALALYQSGKVPECLAAYDQALRINPANLAALRDLGLIQMKLGRHDAALASIDRALALQPGAADLHVNRGIALNGLGRAPEAITAFRRAILLNPRIPEAHNSLGLALLKSGERTGAVAALQAALALRPDYAEAAYNLGRCQFELDHFAEAATAFRQVLKTRPDDIDAWTSLAESHAKQGHADEAGKVLAEALARHPTSVKLHLAQGALFMDKDDAPAALAAFETAWALEPGNSDILLHKAGALVACGREDEALPLYRQIIARDPNQATAYCVLGSLLRNRRQLSEAIACYDKAIALKPDYHEAYLNRANALGDAGQRARALEDYNAAIHLNAGQANAFLYRAGVLEHLKRPDLALEDYAKALALGAKPDEVSKDVFAAKLAMCDWDGFADFTAEMDAKIAAGSNPCTPFTSLMVSDSPALQLKCAANYVRAQKQWPKTRDTAMAPAPAPDGKITIGYFSADFHDHPMLFLMAEVFELHDRERFRIVGFSFGPDQKSAARARVLPFLDAFHDVREMPDAEILALARRERVDIAIDRKGYTENSRSGLFAAGLAPVQVNYLAYPGTMGAPFIDYLVADPVLIGAQDRDFYAEKIAYMPHSYQPNDRRRAVSPDTPSRAALGLPDEAFVFCCFNNNRKIGPDTFARWMRILRQAPGSVLWLMEDNTLVPGHLRVEAERHGIDPARLVFATRMALPDHLARHRQADLFLDTVPYNAHTTTSDALWAGLPVLTLKGQSFTARVAASLLSAAGLPELVVESEEAYERLALHYFQNREALAQMKAKLAENRLTCPLFDSRRYVRDLENLFHRMMERHWAGLPPDHLLP